jgi:hypothetical protein
MNDLIVSIITLLAGPDAYIPYLILIFLKQYEHRFVKVLRLVFGLAHLTYLATIVTADETYLYILLTALVQINTLYIIAHAVVLGSMIGFVTFTEIFKPAMMQYYTNIGEKVLNVFNDYCDAFRNRGIPRIRPAQLDRIAPMVLNVSSPYDTCPICIFDVKELARKMPCCKKFVHSNCVSEHLLKYSTKCPLCNTDIRSLV